MSELKAYTPAFEYVTPLPSRFVFHPLNTNPGRVNALLGIGVPPVCMASELDPTPPFGSKDTARTITDDPPEPPDDGAAGITAADVELADEVPEAFVAVEANVYEVPLVKPEITQDVAGGVTVQVAPPGEAVTV
jgi:hypothetical protein